MSTATELKRLYNEGKKRKTIALLALFVALILSIVISISLGAASPGILEATQVIFYKIFPFISNSPVPQATQIIVFDLRLPRIILAVLAGAGLAAGDGGGSAIGKCGVANR